MNPLAVPVRHVSQEKRTITAAVTVATSPVLPPLSAFRNHDEKVQRLQRLRAAEATICEMPRKQETREAVRVWKQSSISIFAERLLDEALGPSMVPVFGETDFASNNASADRDVDEVAPADGNADLAVSAYSKGSVAASAVSNTRSEILVGKTEYLITSANNDGDITALTNSNTGLANADRTSFAESADGNADKPVFLTPEHHCWRCVGCNFTNGDLQATECAQCDDDRPSSAIFHHASPATPPRMKGIKFCYQEPVDSPQVSRLHEYMEGRILYKHDPGNPGIVEFLQAYSPSVRWFCGIELVAWIQVNLWGASLDGGVYDISQYQAVLQRLDTIAPGKINNEDRIEVMESIYAIAAVQGCTCGKWLVGVNAVNVDEIWGKIALETVLGNLGVAAKVSTPNPPGDQHIICIYCKDFGDPTDLLRVATRLDNLGVRSKSFKLDVIMYASIHFLLASKKYMIKKRK